MFRNMWYLTQFYAYSYRICKYWKVFAMIRGAIGTIVSIVPELGIDIFIYTLIYTGYADFTSFMKKKYKE